MSAAILRDNLTRQPFQPFRVKLSSGDSYEVRHPENALLVRSGIMLAIPDASGQLPETPVWCSFLHVAAVEPLTAAAPGSPGNGRPA